MDINRRKKLICSCSMRQEDMCNDLGSCMGAVHAPARFRLWKYAWTPIAILCDGGGEGGRAKPLS